MSAIKGAVGKVGHGIKKVFSHDDDTVVLDVKDIEENSGGVRVYDCTTQGKEHDDAMKQEELAEPERMDDYARIENDNPLFTSFARQKDKKEHGHFYSPKDDQGIYRENIGKGTKPLQEGWLEHTHGPLFSAPEFTEELENQEELTKLATPGNLKQSEYSGKPKSEVDCKEAHSANRSVFNKSGIDSVRHEEEEGTYVHQDMADLSPSSSRHRRFDMGEWRDDWKGWDPLNKVSGYMPSMPKPDLGLGNLGKDIGKEMGGFKDHIKRPHVKSPKVSPKPSN
ncbi:hypothetical protein DIURU_002361 [Diutina rugosa]|uniref:Uncharacterized protein n=1 Tax=Diutina rugosa TaxID=5481 RepID=A0A642UWW3_DIURU|nr:uncharacterized protein DIURU_002361 [Diutina rugosa]KAA8903475.1 hypothetical protein DIURU_002361 [Diutina rugosa]